MGFAVVQFLNGLASASSLFLIACGLSIVFGVTRVINFAHGSFYMLGAYVAYSLTSRLGAGLGAFVVAAVGAAAAAGVVGIAVELVVLRRIYRSPELFQLLATFGVVLVVQDATLYVWGGEDLLGPRIAELAGAVGIAGRQVPEYDLAMIALGPLVLAGLWVLFRRTRWGLLVRAATEDRDMAAALGVDARRLFTSVFFLGTFLAGLGGALQIPRQAASLSMDLAVVVEAFVVVVIGGMGSIVGAYLASVLVSVLQAFGIVLLPKVTLVFVFAVMAVVLIARPWGLLGEPEGSAAAPSAEPMPPVAPLSPRMRIAAALGLLALAAVPWLDSGYALILLTEILIVALFAASLQFVIGGGGMVSFGHAAYFGLGAYAAALLVRDLRAPMEVAIALAPLVGGLGALVFGWFCVRRRGIYLAMLTLAFAQVLWAAAVQWIALTGGDNGILGVWPSAWARDTRVFYWLVLAVSAGGIVALRFLLHAPFGMALRAVRDAPLRAEAIGIDVRVQQWLGFAAAGVFAGLAGALYAFSKGSVFPDSLSVSRSVSGLVAVLLGGVQTLSGPVVGAAVYTLLEDTLVRTAEHWRAFLGALILVFVIAFPRGLAGFARLAFGRSRP